jgi:translation elongation factor EF-Tu-like GTPase
MRELPRDVEVEIIFLPAEAGGRQGPAFSGYRPQFHYGGHDWDAIQTYPDVERVNPGDTVRAYLTFMSPEMHVGNICAGTIFLLREGHKTVGYGRVTQVLELEHSAQRIREEASRP